MRQSDMGKGTLHQIYARVAFIMSGYVLNVSLVYMLGDPVLYGLVGIMINMTNLARVLLSTGLPQATSHFIADNDEEMTYPILRTSLKLQWAIAAVIVIIYVAGAPIWAGMLNDRSLVPYFWASAPLIPLMGVFQVLQSYFNGTRRFVIQSWLNILYTATRVAFALVLVALGFEVYGVLVGFALSLAVAALVSWWYVRPRTGKANPVSRALLAFAVPLMVLAIGQAVLVNLDLLQIKAYYPSSAAVGYYSGMASLSRTPYFLFTAFSITLLPIVTNALRHHHRDVAASQIAKSTTFLLIGALPVVAIVAAVPAQLLDFVYPLPYAAAAEALVWATIAQTLLAIVASFSAAITADGRPYLSMSSWLVCIPVQLVAGALLIPKYGMTGTALASLIAATTGLVFSGALTRHLFGRLLDPIPVGKAAVASVAIFLLLRLPTHYSLIALPFACFGALGLYGGLVIAMKAVKVSELKALFAREKTMEPTEEIDPLEGH